MLMKLISFILHIDKYLVTIVNQYSRLTYALIFLIIFLETGIVIAPFLPGDSLLFAAGAIAATGALDIIPLFAIIFAAAVLGDAANYHIGKFLGPKVFNKESSLIFHKEYLLKAQSFYDKNGTKTIILARFIPIVRTFAPFVAGIGKMPYKIFLIYNVIGAAIWSGLFTFGGYIFGNIPWVKERFSVLVIAIIVISLIPLVKEIFVHFIKNKKTTPPTSSISQ